MAVNRVEELLHKVSGALDQAGVPYAVIGGNAVAAWVATVDEGAVRATKDVDILLRRADLDHAAKALAKVELDQHEVLGVTMFLDRKNPSPKTGARYPTYYCVGRYAKGLCPARATIRASYLDAHVE